MPGDDRADRAVQHPDAAALAAVVDRASVAIALHDSSWRCLLVNDTMVELNRRPASDTVGLTPAEYLPDLWPQLQPLYERALHEPVLGVEIEGETPAHPGERRWYRCDLWPVPLGGQAGIAIMVDDVTERRRAVQALRQSEARFRAMADDVPLIVWLHDETGAQRFVNQTFCDFFGIDREAIGTDEWQVMLHPDGADAYIAAFAEAVDRRREFHAEVQVRAAGGDWRWMESWGRPRFDEHGRYLGHVGTSADVTDRVRAQQAVRAAAEFTSRVLDNLYAFVAVLDPDGVLLDCNEAPLRVAGIGRDEVVGRPFWECHWWVGDAERERTLRDAIESATAGETVRYDVEIRTVDDGLTWIDFQLAPLRDSAGTVTHLIPSGMVISDRKAAELQRAELLANEQQARRRAEVLEQNATLLSTAPTVERLAIAVIEHLCDTLDLAAVRILVIDDVPAGAIRAFGAGAGGVGALAAQHVTDALPGALAIRSNEPVHVRRRHEIEAWFPDLERLGGGESLDDVEALLALPLRSADRQAVGALVVASSRSDGFDHTELALLHELAGQTGPALERVTLLRQLVAAHRQEHQIAMRLQRALLPDRLVEHPSIRLAARYRAAGDLLAVGGDWYDSYEWPSADGAVTTDVGVVVGDVVGHDLEAAAAMGRLRSATAALVPIGAPAPGAILDALARSAEGPANVDFVTAAALVLDLSSGEVRYSTAGHPPPLLIDADGTTTWFDRANHPPIGRLQVDVRTEVSARLAPGSTVVLYSDGLVERRHRDIATGLDRLERSAAAHAHLEVDDLADRLLADFADDDHDDDAIVLVLRWDVTSGARHQM